MLSKNLPVRKWVAILFAASISFPFSGCGGGGGSSSSGSSPTSTGTLGGVAAVGTPIIGGTINVICAAGSALASTTTGNTGTWQVTLYGQTLPCAVQVNGGTISGVTNTTPYHSIATTVGTVNVSPLTDLMVANLTGSATPSTWFAGLISTPAPLTAITQTQVNTALTNLSAALPALTPLSTNNPITTAFMPNSGNPSDDMLTALENAMSSNGSTQTSLLSSASTPTIIAPAGFGAALTTAFTGTTSGSSGTGGTTSGGGTPSSATLYAYVANYSSNTVSQYTIGTGGALTAMSTATVTAGYGPFSVAVDPFSKYAYVANTGSNTVSQYTIGTGGALTAMTPATVTTGTGPHSVTLDPSGKYAYVANSGDNTVSQYTIGTGGALTAMSTPTVAAGSYPSYVTINASSKFAYVANLNDNTVSQYTIGTGGALTAMTPATVTTGTGPHSVTVNPSGKYAYVPNAGDSTVSQYTIGTGGALTAMSTATVTAGTVPYSVTIDPTGNYAYVANYGSNNFTQYTIGTGGALTAMTPATVTTGTGPHSVTLDPSGLYAYVANSGDNTISEYTCGALSAMTTATVANAGVTPISITIAKSSTYTGTTSGGGSCTPASYTIGGTITGLSGSVVLQDNAGDNLSVSANGTFTFPTKLTNGIAYNVQVLTQPSGQFCALTDGSGTATNTVTSVVLNCTASYVSEGGLTWMPISNTYYTYAQASTFCAGTINGLSGWRMPTGTELYALYASGAINSAAYATINNQGWMLAITWSSTPDGVGNHDVMIMTSGFESWDPDTNDNYVTCVR